MTLIPMTALPMNNRIIISLLAVLCCLPAMAGGKYKTDKDISYKEGISRCKLDVSYVRNAKDRPVIVWFHGGGLTEGSKHTPEALLKEDYVVVAAGYRLYPETQVADIIDDAAAAVAWVVKNISRYGGSPSKIYLAGHSAGGYLVAMLGLDKHYLAKYGADADSMAAIVPYSGQMITHFTERAARGIPATRPVIDELSPLYHIRPDAPPFLVVTGGRETELYRRYEENAYFVEMMKLVGHKNMVFCEEEGFTHGGMAAPAHLLLMKYIKERNEN